MNRDSSFASETDTPAIFPGNGFTDAGNGAFYSGSFTFATIVPEPASIGSLATGAVALLARRRKNHA